MELPIDNATTPFLTIGQVAEAVGVQQAFLRRLDQENVVRPIRSEGGQRRYSRQQIDQVAKVCALVAEGLTLAGVRRVLELEARVAVLETELAEERRNNE